MSGWLTCVVRLRIPSVTAAMSATPVRQPVEPVDPVDAVDHPDDPEHREADREDRRERQRPAGERVVDEVDADAERDRAPSGQEHLTEELPAGSQVKRSSSDAEAAAAAPPANSATRSPVVMFNGIGTQSADSLRSVNGRATTRKPTATASPPAARDRPGVDAAGVRPVHDPVALRSSAGRAGSARMRSGAASDEHDDDRE